MSDKTFEVRGPKSELELKVGMIIALIAGGWGVNARIIIVNGGEEIVHELKPVEGLVELWGSEIALDFNMSLDCLLKEMSGLAEAKYEEGYRGYQIINRATGNGVLNRIAA